MLSIIREWADPLLLVSGIGFAASLAPTIVHQYRHKASTVPLGTSVTTALLLLPVLTISLAFHWWFALAANVATTTLWVIVAYQRWLYAWQHGPHLPDVSFRTINEARIERGLPPLTHDRGAP